VSVGKLSMRPGWGNVFEIHLTITSFPSLSAKQVRMSLQRRKPPRAFSKGTRLSHEVDFSSLLGLACPNTVGWGRDDG
jgi:hypothetical protein